MTTAMTVVLLSVLAISLAYLRRPFWAWVAPGAIGLALWSGSGASPVAFWAVTGPFLALAAVTGIPAIRRSVITGKLLRLMRPIFPAMSDTERTALEAGTVWWDAELFSGRPNWRRLQAFERPGLTSREKAFLDDEVEEICRLVDNERVDQEGDLSEEAWRFLKEKGFMGMIIPTDYGGLGFSPEANSAVVTKVSSHNVTLAVTVMVPNSLGPAELLLHYGTEEQKDYYLPRLADGREVPAFALTEPGAGSDAGSMTSNGVVCRGEWQGKEVLGIRLNWNKRYITLAPVATLLGLAFKLSDPDGLLGGEQDLGITCALVPVDLDGVETGRRHDPLGVKFLNGPTTGQDVFIPLDNVIGGKQMVGQGWRMLMDCLSAGRSISLPGLSVGGAKVASSSMSAYSLIREQFGLPIARFEGIEEPLARIFGNTWAMDAARELTASAVATGQKPSVISAIVKCWLTEGMRDVVNDAMDVQGGAGICEGPRNVLAPLYHGAPIGITVEGANILTRTLIVYGQGALRCHPYAFREMEAARKNDLVEFDHCFFKHMGLVVSNATRALLLAVTDGRLEKVPFDGPAKRHAQRLSKLSASFAVVSEVSMATLGGALKRKEKITGRLADALAWMYMGSAAISRFETEGRRQSDTAMLDWACETAAQKIEEALDGVLANLPNRLLAAPLSWWIFPLGRRAKGPDDRLGARVVRNILEDPEARERLTAGIYMPPQEEPGLGALDRGYELAHAATEPRAKLKAAVKQRILPRGREVDIVEQAVEEGVLTPSERDALLAALEAQQDLIQVDAFDPQHYLDRCGV